MRRQLHIIVLCEGRRDWNFIRNYLRQKGYDISRNVRVSFPSNDHTGAGDKFVIDNFAANMQSTRSYAAKNASKNRWLLVHIDADTYSLEYRFDMLNSQLPESEHLNDQDLLCMLIPKRHTETWVYYILNSSESISETEIYKTRVTDVEIRSAGQQLALNDPRGNSNCPPSLVDGYSQLCRLPQ
jgi:hypothetical protein